MLTTLWIVVGAGAILLLVAAVIKKDSEHCKGININIKGVNNNFFVDKSDSIAEALINNLGFMEKGTVGIAFITLIGAAIGLMNIMLVAVNERTGAASRANAANRKNLVQKIDTLTKRVGVEELSIR